MVRPDNPQFRNQPHPEQGNPLRGGLRILAKEILDAKNQRIGPDGQPATFDQARRTFAGLLPLMTTGEYREDIGDARGMLRQFPETERPLFADTQMTRELHARYNLLPDTFGVEAISALKNIATGRNRGRMEFSEEYVPIVDVVKILRDTFEPDTVKSVVIDVVDVRQELIKTPGISFPQDLAALEEAVVELPSFKGQEVAEALVGVVDFSLRHKFENLFRRSAASLRNFATIPGNTSLLMEYEEFLKTILAALPEGVVGRRSLKEVLLNISGPASMHSESAETVRDRYAGWQVGTQRGRKDAEGLFDPDLTAEFPIRRRPESNQRDTQ